MYDPPPSGETTPKLGLPYLYPAQAQKEFTVNEALALLDATIFPVVEGTRNDPPAAAVTGEAWLVGSNPTGLWEGMSAHIATWQGDRWLLVRPATGSLVYDRSLGQRRMFDITWSAAATVADPDGGTTIDTEARTAIVAILQALRAIGVVPPE